MSARHDPLPPALPTKRARVSQFHQAKAGNLRNFLNRNIQRFQVFGNYAFTVRFVPTGIPGQLRRELLQGITLIYVFKGTFPIFIHPQHPATFHPIGYKAGFGKYI